MCWSPEVGGKRWTDLEHFFERDVDGCGFEGAVAGGNGMVFEKLAPPHDFGAGDLQKGVSVLLKLLIRHGQHRTNR